MDKENKGKITSNSILDGEFPDITVLLKVILLFY